MGSIHENLLNVFGTDENDDHIDAYTIFEAEPNEVDCCKIIKRIVQEELERWTH